jgi:hypothetical protein
MSSNERGGDRPRIRRDIAACGADGERGGRFVVPRPAAAANWNRQPRPQHLRALEAGGHPAAAARLSAERAAEIRQRVLEGAYNSLDVIDQVARRMLERGDL